MAASFREELARVRCNDISGDLDADLPSSVLVALGRYDCAAVLAPASLKPQEQFEGARSLVKLIIRLANTVGGTRKSLDPALNGPSQVAEPPGAREHSAVLETPPAEHLKGEEENPTVGSSSRRPLAEHSGESVQESERRESIVPKSTASICTVVEGLPDGAVLTLQTAILRLYDACYVSRPFLDSTQQVLEEQMDSGDSLEETFSLALLSCLQCSETRIYAVMLLSRLCSVIEPNYLPKVFAVALIGMTCAWKDVLALRREVGSRARHSSAGQGSKSYKSCQDEIYTFSYYKSLSAFFKNTYCLAIFCLCKDRRASPLLDALEREDVTGIVMAQVRLIETDFLRHSRGMRGAYSFTATPVATLTSSLMAYAPGLASREELAADSTDIAGAQATSGDFQLLPLYGICLCLWCISFMSPRFGFESGAVTTLIRFLRLRAAQSSYKLVHITLQVLSNCLQADEGGILSGGASVVSSPSITSAGPEDGHGVDTSGDLNDAPQSRKPNLVVDTMLSNGLNSLLLQLSGKSWVTGGGIGASDATASRAGPSGTQSQANPIQQLAGTILASLETRVRQMTTWKSYIAELEAGVLSMTPSHTSQTFWKANCGKMLENGCGVICRLCTIGERALEQCPQDSCTLLVVLNDLGMFAITHPNGREVLSRVPSAKTLAMRCLSADAEDVRNTAVLTLSQLLIQGWRSV